MGTRLLDQYTLLHWAVGIVAYFIGISLPITIFIHIMFEVLENTKEGILFINKYLHWIWPGSKEYSDTMTNSVGDTLATITGWLTAYYIDSLGKQAGWYYANSTRPEANRS